MYWLLIVLALGVAAATVLWWRIARRRQALRLLMRHSQQVCEQVVEEALTVLHWPYDKPLNSTPVADVWGHGIMGFEYETATPKIKITQEQLQNQLRDTAEQQHLKSIDPRYPAFMITDFWERGGRTHFDVAYVANAPTIAYLQDVQRV
ncbi:hypothetical protein ACFQ3L_05015 [Lacticaseibacillus jixianensis]|uniref:DUF5590 domain-containing protein n=1 Tax=Lacticaseibacillus jixianensis TaxID=2486012 RepID=A0ABW4B9E1_9LACO|nr:hypothetical protein [Lacticaseibacillus jixianensis]